MKEITMFNKDKYSRMHDEIDSMSIIIPKDIIEVGIINSLNMIGKIQAYMDRLSGMLGEALQNLTLMKNLNEKLKSKYSFKDLQIRDVGLEEIFSIYYEKEEL